jgi:hypothetical protein
MQINNIDAIIIDIFLLTAIEGWFFPRLSSQIKTIEIAIRKTAAAPAPTRIQIDIATKDIIKMDEINIVFLARLALFTISSLICSSSLALNRPS